MAWTKPLGTATAKAANEDLQMRFYFSDADATPPNALRASLRVAHDKGRDETSDALVTDDLTAAEQTTLLGLFVKIRNKRLTALGYTKS